MTTETAPAPATAPVVDAATTAAPAADAAASAPAAVDPTAIPDAATAATATDAANAVAPAVDAAHSAAPVVAHHGPALADIFNGLGANVVYLMGFSFILGSLFTVLILVLLDYLRRNKTN